EERRLRARDGEAHLFGAWNGPADLFSECHDGLVDEEVRGPALELFAHRGDDGRMRVPENEGPGAKEVVDILATARVVELRPLSLLDDEGRVVGVSRGAQHAARKAARGRLQQALLGCGSAGLAHGSPLEVVCGAVQATLDRG